MEIVNVTQVWVFAGFIYRYFLNQYQHCLLHAYLVLSFSKQCLNKQIHIIKNDAKHPYVLKWLCL